MIKKLKINYLLHNSELDLYYNLYFYLKDIENLDFTRLFSTKYKKYSITARRLYTGYYDSNYREIYEGDIILHTAYLDNYPFKTFSRKIVIGSENCPITNCSWLFETDDNYKRPTNIVIGNIFENPELKA